MKTDKLKLVYVLLCATVGALLFGTLVGGIDPALSTVATLLSFVGSLAISYGYSPREQKQMAMTCGAITAGITLSCDNPLSAGVVATFYIANKAEIASITYDPTNTMLATDITMVATKKFYKVEGQLQSLEPSTAMVKGTYVNQFEHSVVFLIFKIDADTKKQILNMKDGNFVCIVENNFTGVAGNTKYEIYGAGSGLKAEVIERNPSDAETLGAFRVELKTQEYAREVKPPVALYDTDLVTTDALVASLI